MSTLLPPEVSIPQSEESLEFQQEEFNPSIKNSQDNPVDDDPIVVAFKTLRDKIETQEKPVREVMIRQWKLQQLFWQGFQRPFWNSLTGMWGSIQQTDLPSDIDVDLNDYGKTINIYRAYGQAIAGALTTAAPGVKFFPKDADKINDIFKAKGYSKLSEFIANYNQIVNKLTEAIVISYNQGLFAFYNYNHTSEKYGIAMMEKEIQVENAYQVSSCPSCGLTVNERKLDYAPGTDLTLDETLNSETDQFCPECAQLENESIDPNSGLPLEPPRIQNQVTVRQEMETKFEKKTKSRQIIEVFGPLEVKIPASAKKIEEIGFVNLEREKHFAEMRALYPEIRNLIKGGSSSDQSYERWARSNYENQGEYLTNYTTVNQIWLRPWQYFMLDEDETVQQLLKYYPEGAYVVFVGDVFAEACPANMDDHWTFAVNPLSNRIYCEAWGRGMVPIQEMTNDLILLELETVKYGIPAIFANARYFDQDSFKKMRSAPGMVIPVQEAPQGGVKDIFHETKAATLSDEVPELESRIKALADFISAAPPSIFGGPATGSKTLGEYEQSRNQALQVLSILWKIVLFTYVGAMSKAVKGYHKSMLEDEKVVKPNGRSFINELIKLSELNSGDVGEVYPESGEQFPTTWPQKRALLLELLGMQNEFVNMILAHPENSYLAASILGFDELYIPGDNQRNKQLFEIAQLINQAPLDMMTPSIPIEPSIDDAQVHIEVLKAFLTSEHGEALKLNNQMGYQNVVLHLQQHEFLLQQQMMQQQEAEKEEEGKGKEEEVGPVES